MNFFFKLLQIKIPQFLFNCTFLFRYRFIWAHLRRLMLHLLFQTLCGRLKTLNRLFFILILFRIFDDLLYWLLCLLFFDVCLEFYRFYGKFVPFWFLFLLNFLHLNFHCLIIQFYHSRYLDRDYFLDRSLKLDDLNYL